MTLLAACNTDGGPGPLKLSFTATGTIQNWDPTADAELSYTTRDTKLVVGKITGADNKVNIEMTADQATSVSMRSFNEYLTNWKASGSGCDYSKMVAVDTTFRFSEGFDFTTQAGTASVVYAQTSVKNADGTTTWNRTQFYYAQKEGSLIGKITCPANQTADYNIVLKPGWNTVQASWTYDPVTQISNARTFKTTAQTTKYDGPWYAYAKSN